MHSYPIYQDYQKRAEPLAEVLCRRLIPASVSIDNSTERLQVRARLRELLLDAGGQAGAGARLQLAGRRPGLSGAPGRGAELRLLGQPLCERPERDREEDPHQRLADHDRRRLGGGICRHRSGAIAADPRAHPDEDRHDAGMDVAADGRPPGPLGAGLRPAQAGLHG